MNVLVLLFRRTSPRFLSAFLCSEGVWEEERLGGKWLRDKAAISFVLSAKLTLHNSGHGWRFFIVLAAGHRNVYAPSRIY